ncbi:conserved hypothetical protein [Trichinella spiralis]|uniref:hypothetical protein n=1 Tax=Trichinella spiralis TaxID=6334 RepID=UPI0001EFBD7E|nr:conserved hypothetical protein [Trichinella spiralis]
MEIILRSRFSVAVRQCDRRDFPELTCSFCFFFITDITSYVSYEGIKPLPLKVCLSSYHQLLGTFYPPDHACNDYFWQTLLLATGEYPVEIMFQQVCENADLSFE